MDVRLAVQLRLRVPDCSGSKLFILELPYALPVLRSPAGRDEGWMRYADFSEIET